MSLSEAPEYLLQDRFLAQSRCASSADANKHCDLVSNPNSRCTERCKNLRPRLSHTPQSTQTPKHTRTIHRRRQTCTDAYNSVHRVHQLHTHIRKHDVHPSKPEAVQERLSRKGNDSITVGNIEPSAVWGGCGVGVDRIFEEVEQCCAEGFA